MHNISWAQIAFDKSDAASNSSNQSAHTRRSQDTPENQKR